MTSPPDDTTTDTSAIIAALRVERDAALAREAALAKELAAHAAALAQRNSEYGERIDHQAATIDVLKAMSASPGDPQPVFDLIARRARNLCSGAHVGLFEFDGTLVHVRAWSGIYHAGIESRYPKLPTRETISSRAILERRIFHIKDADADLDLLEAIREAGSRSILSVPLMRAGAAIGAISLNALERGGFSDGQVELLKTFAEQAVIAITSAETYRALQTRTSDLQQSLEYQTATSDVLNVISRSTFDLQPVLSTVAETAARLCVADQAALVRHEGGTLSLAANWGFPPEYEARMNEIGPLRVGADAQTVSHRAIIERRVIHIPDVAAVPGYPDPPIRLGRQRTSLGVPLLREGEPIGLILLARQRVEPFTDRQIDLVRTFADQAVIAIENTRLITEQREALEQQTATAEVLQVINASPGNLAPVFATILDKAMRLCEAAFGGLFTYDGERFHTVASLGTPPALTEFRTRNPPSPLPGSTAARLLETRRTHHILDRAQEPDYLAGEPGARAMVELGGARSMLNVPLNKDDNLLGYISIYRQELRPFSDKQIALLESFATQAVIAKENARLINEQREALEQQTATAEVLQVINANPGNLTPVFDTLLTKAMHLCDVAFGTLRLYDGERFHLAASQGASPTLLDFQREPLRPGQGVLRMLAGQDVINRPDIIDGEAYRTGSAAQRALVELGGARSNLAVALRRAETLLGYISVYRREVRPFTDKQVALLQNFAAQSVIAIENARLITEQREALEQQTATAEVLQVINRSRGDLTPVFDAMLEKAMRLCEAAFGELHTFDGERFSVGALLGIPLALADFRRNTQPANAPGSIIRRIREGDRVVHIADAMADQLYRTGEATRRALVDLGGARTVLTVALRKDDTLLGIIAVYRQEVRPFSDKQVALLENFAAQAVIAMENARLLTEQQEALEQQTATAEVLQVINASPGDLEPVFAAILNKAHTICGAEMGSLQIWDGTHSRAVATLGYPEEVDVMLRQPSPPRRPHLDLIAANRVFHIPDVTVEPAPDEMALAFRKLTGVRTNLFVPLRRDGALLGFITANRREVRPFTDKEITLLENFAAQAVIAMENARLITEQREALEQQTATAEVLQVINASPGNLTPVFDAILEKAHALCGAATGSLQLYDGEFFRAVATRGLPDEFANILRQPRRSDLRVALLRDAPFVQIADTADPVLTGGDKTLVAAPHPTGVRTLLRVPLRKDDALLGLIVAGRREVRPFSQKEISLLQSFAAQAVIAMENARLLDEIRQRQAELRTTFDNMGDGVAMFDADLRLAAWNRNFQQIIDLPDALLRERPRYADYMRLLAERGEFGTTDIEVELRHRIEDTDQELRLERVRPDGRVIEVRRNAVPGGGFVLIYSDITERKRSEEEIRAARDAAETALRELKTAQANLIQAEKMASLGQLTAGIAHEIKNPLNFVNNFSALSTELIDELRDVLAPEPLGETARTEVDDLTALLKGNLEKVVQHGQRADGIVRSMLDHSRGSSGERRMVDLNALIDEALNLAYHGARAQDQSFNITLERDFGAGIAPIEVNPQDITRVFLNLFANGFYAVTRRARSGGDAAFVPTLKVTTIDAGEAVEIRVRDNGTGIPADIRDKLFQPFFTTKPTGEGTGLGLSITYDIVTQQHGGSIAVDSKVGDYSEFTIRLPRNP